MKKIAQKFLVSLLVFGVLIIQFIPLTQLTAQAWDGSASVPAQVNGVYQIATAGELAWLRDETNSGRSCDAVLTRDIDLEGKNWVAMGTTANPYTGTLDGRNHTISGLSVTASAAWGGGFVGKNQGAIQNLVLKGAIQFSGNGAGSICAWNDGGTVKNCTSYVNVTSTGAAKDNIGGLVGQNSNGATVATSAFVGKLTARGAKKVGGIVGHNISSAVYGCVNSADIEGATGVLASNTGGIVGHWALSGSNSKTAVYNCYNTGDVTSSSTNCVVSGIVGVAAVTSSQSGATFTLFNNYNSGVITGTTKGHIIAKTADVNYSQTNKTGNYYLAATTDYSAGAVSESDMNTAQFVNYLNSEKGGDYGLTVGAELQYIKGDSTPMLTWQNKTAPTPVEVKKVKLTGEAKQGSTLTAVATGEGQEAATNVTYKWQISANGTDFTDIENATGATFAIPGEEKYLNKVIRVVAAGENDSSATSDSTKKVTLSDSGKVKKAKESLTLQSEGQIKEEKTLSLPQAGEEGTAITWASSDSGIINPKTGQVTLPASDIREVTLTATITLGNTNDTKTFQYRVYSRGVIEAEKRDLTYLENAKKALENSWYQLRPTYGVDTNVNDFVRGKLESLGYRDITVSVKESGDTEYVGENGDITYFYKDPNTVTEFLWYRSVAVTFALKKNEAEVTHQKNAVIYWDQGKAKQAVKEQVVDNITEGAIKGDNSGTDTITENLVLPKVVGGKRWAIVSWRSSDTDVIAIDSSGQGTADTLYNPYVGQVKRDVTDKTVTLTATVVFQRTALNEAEIKLTKTFTVTVKSMGDDLQREMQKQLDENYTVDKLNYSNTTEKIDPSRVKFDIQLLTPRTTGIKEHSDYTLDVKSNNTDVISVKYYRAVVYRPLVGEAPREVTLTVTMKHKAYSVSVSKEIKVTILPLTQAEIDSEIALMEKAKQEYLNGVAANSKSKNAVMENLTPFSQGRYNSQNEWEWVYSNGDMTNGGVIPVSIDINKPSEQWDKFLSSNPAVISHETLQRTQPKYNKEVTVTSCLSSQTFEKYAEKYPQNREFQKLYRQAISAKVTILGTDGANPAPAAGEFSVKFSLVGDEKHGATGHKEYQTWIDRETYQAKEGDSVLDAFKKTLANKGYAYEGSNYVISITTPDGKKLGSGDNGSMSGWMYAVNGVLGNTYADQHFLKEGDHVVWFYTEDLMSDERITGDIIHVGEDETRPSYTAQWFNFRGSAQNNGVTAAKTPVKADDTKLNFAYKLREENSWSSISDPIVVNENVYIVVGSELLVLNSKGELLQKAALATSVDYTCRPLYTDGMVVVPLSGGRLQALAADSLKTVWITKEVETYSGDNQRETHQSLSTLTYSDGTLYFGTAVYSGSSVVNGVYTAVRAKDGTTLWTYDKDKSGYYWSGAGHLQNTVVFAGDAGVLVSHHPTKDTVTDTLKIGQAVRASVVVEGNSVYFTTVDGKLHRVQVRADGTFGTHTSVQFCEYSTGTPAVHGGKAYVGGFKQWGNGAKDTGVLGVIDTATMKVEHSVKAPADVKSAPLISTGYDGKTYVYFTANTTPGALYVYRTGSGDSRAAALYTPQGENQNYCMVSPIADQKGNVYYTNDSGKLFSLAVKAGVKDGEKPADKDQTTEDSTAGAQTGDTAPIALWAVFIVGAMALGYTAKKERAGKMNQ